MNKEYSIHQLYPFIHWPSFFNDWSYDPQYAKIASLQGCDVVRASSLSDFAEDDRTEASDAMQLLKEANRMI
ncbi:MAG: 5-methyltetrahydrofolate--homocysteine methyltransferase, partial [Bacteroides sp.]|nr:5-methyltetrahydrofolate--homocysteine methyltransferase [Bacteroides sp.]